MKWILVCFAIWNMAGALLRAFRMLLERVPVLGRLYPDRGMLPIDEARSLAPDYRTRYRDVVEKLCRQVSLPVPQLLCSPQAGMFAGTRGWRSHELHLSRGILRQATDQELHAVIAH